MTDEMTDIALYDFMYDRRYNKKYSWGEISDVLQLGLNNNSTQKKFSRLCKKLGKQYKPVKELPIQLTEKFIDVSMDSTTVKPSVADLTEDDIYATKYGDIPPTDYISSLSHDEWIEYYLPYMVWRLDYLTELREKLWTEKDLIVLLPRNHGKSDTVTALFVRWILEVRQPILVLCASNSLAKDIFLMVEDILTEPQIRKDYGDVLNNANKGEQKMYYVPSIEYRYRDAMFRAATQQTKVKGSHPSWVHFDDVIDGEYLNVSSNEMVERWYDRSIVPMRRHTDDNPTRITATATRQGVADFYQFLIDKRSYEKLHKEALWKDDADEWQTLECPNFPLHSLLEYMERDPIGFQEQMQNNPVPDEGLYFDKQDWYEYTSDSIDLSDATWYIAVDPATGMTPSADFFALIVCAIKDGILYVHDGVVKRNLTHAKQMEYIHHFNELYNPTIIHIEKIMTQQILHQQMDWLPNVRAFTHTQKNAKYQRIDAIPFSKHVVYVNKDSQPYTELLIEFRSYDQTPSTASKKDDALDAVSMIVHKHGRYLKGGSKVDWSKVGKLYVEGRR